MKIKMRCNWGFRNSANWCELHIWNTKHWRKAFMGLQYSQPYYYYTSLL